MSENEKPKSHWPQTVFWALMLSAACLLSFNQNVAAIVLILTAALLVNLGDSTK